jgi:hypothetical protein
MMTLSCLLGLGKASNNSNNDSTNIEQPVSQSTAPVRSLYIYTYASHPRNAIPPSARLLTTLRRNHPNIDPLLILHCHNIAVPKALILGGETGLDEKVQEYVMQDSRASNMVKNAVEKIEKALEGEKSVLVLVRCKDGRGASVAVAERLRKEVEGRDEGVRVVVRHTELGRGAEGEDSV